MGAGTAPARAPARPAGRASVRSAAKPAAAAPKNIVDARHAAALAAWPDMPTNLPLSLALEEDDDDDAKTKRGKAAARKAAQDAETQWSANVR